MTDEELRTKLELCGAGDLTDLTWESAASFLRSF
jgi:hypothetical protein